MVPSARGAPAAVHRILALLPLTHAPPKRPQPWEHCPTSCNSPATAPLISTCVRRRGHPRRSLCIAAACPGSCLSTSARRQSGSGSGAYQAPSRSSGSTGRKARPTEFHRPAEAAGRSGITGALPLPQRRALARRCRVAATEAGWNSCYKSSKASKATRTPTGTATRSAAGATPACLGPTGRHHRNPHVHFDPCPHVSFDAFQPAEGCRRAGTHPRRPPRVSATVPCCSAITTSAPTSISTPT